MCLADNMGQLSELGKALVLANNQGLITCLSIWELVAPIIASTPASEARMPAVVVASIVVETNILIITSEVGQPVTEVDGLFL